MNSELNVIFAIFSKHLYNQKEKTSKPALRYKWMTYFLKPLFKYVTFKLEKASKWYQIFLSKIWLSKRIGLLFFNKYVPEFCMYFYKHNVSVCNNYFVLLLSNYSPFYTLINVLYFLEFQNKEFLALYCYLMSKN